MIIRWLTHGFSWGQLSVERMIEHKGHRLVRVVTNRQELRIRVTPTGLIRISGDWKLESGEVVKS